jgi:hypothetical protein
MDERLLRDAASGAPAAVAAPDRSRRRTHIAFALVTTGIACLWLAGTPRPLGCPSVILIVPLVAIGAVVATSRLRAVPTQAPDTARLTVISGVWLQCFSALLIVAVFVATVTAPDLDIRYKGMAPTRQNLRQIGRAIASYCDTTGDYPAALADLVDPEHFPQWYLVSVTDPYPRDATDDPMYSSFAYMRGVGAYRSEPDVILAYERVAVSPRLPLHCVLFGDGEIDYIGRNKLREAMHKDRARRAELGWPQSP